MCVFFFQAEDGIRDDLVTGVQTCALPILVAPRQVVAERHRRPRAHEDGPGVAQMLRGLRCALEEQFDVLGSETLGGLDRSEERRVGKEWRSRWTPANTIERRTTTARV